MKKALFQKFYKLVSFIEEVENNRILKGKNEFLKFIRMYKPPYIGKKRFIR